MSETRSRVWAGLQVSAIALVFSVIAQVLVTAVLARLLEPGAFGLVATVNVAIRFLVSFSELGLAALMLNRPTLDRESLAPFWTISLLLGVACWLGISALAPALEHWFRLDGFAPALRLASVVFLVNALTVVPMALARRRFHFSAVAGIELTAQILGYGLTAVVLARAGFGSWSLIVAALAQAGVLCVGAWLVARPPFALSTSRDALRPIAAVGSRFSLVNIAEFFAANGDTLLLARAFGATELGFYNRASLLANLPSLFVVNLFTKVLFPVLSRVHQDRERLRQIFLAGLFTAVYISASISLNMCVSAPDLVHVLLGDRWASVVPLVRLLLLVVPLLFMSNMFGITFDAVLAVNQKLAVQYGALLLLLGLFALALSTHTLAAFPLALLTTELVRVSAYTALSRRVLHVAARHVLGTAGRALGLALVSVAANVLLVDVLGPDWPPVVRLALSVIGCAAVSLLTFLAFPSAFSEAMSVLPDSVLALTRRARRFLGARS